MNNKQNYETEKFWTDIESVHTYKELLKLSEDDRMVVNQESPDVIFNHLKMKHFLKERVYNIINDNE